MTFKDKVKKYITEKKLITQGDKLLCALSGGGDSVALLHTLKTLANELEFTLLAAHFNHGIRGEEADGDQEFSQSLCHNLGVPFFAKKEDIPASAKVNGEGLEECARNRRYAFLFGVAAEQGCNKIATAHHATDNTETVLFHLIRGSGINGLGGIAPQRQDGVIRPLLCVSRAEIEDFLTDISAQYVTDSTNADTVMTRNFIRLKMLPLVREINPAVDKAISRLCDSAREDEEYFLTEAGKIPKNAPLSYLRDLPSPILKRYLRIRYEEASGHGFQLDHERTEEICRQIKNGASAFRFSLAGEIAAVAERNSLIFIKDKYTPEPFEIFISHTGEYTTEGGNILVTESAEEFEAWKSRQAAEGKTVYKTKYAYSGNSICITARSRKAGDKYLRGGMNRAVRKELNAVGYPAHKGDSLPCFCDGDGIFWVPPLRPRDSARSEDVQNSKQLIYIGYTEN